MSLTDHLHRKSDPIRAFLDERLVDFSAAKENWTAAQLGNPLVGYADDWHLVGMAIDQRIRMMLAPVHFVAPTDRPHDVLTTTILSVLSELEDIQSRYQGALGELLAEDERRLLQVCYVLAMYDAYARSSYSSQRNSPLHSLKSGAGWKAHLNRIPENDIYALQRLVEPAVDLFPLLADRHVSIGPIFDDSHLVDGADGDLIINGTLIEIKCEAPGFRARAVQQAIAYSLLDSSGKYELERVSIYLARFGTLATWKLDDIIRKVSKYRYGYKELRQEFHEWLLAQDDERSQKREALEESKLRFAAQWQAVSDAGTEVGEAIFIDNDAQLAATRKLAIAIRELHHLEDESGLDIHRR